MTKQLLAEALAQTIRIKTGMEGKYKPHTAQTIEALFNLEELYKLLTKKNGSR